MNHLLHYHFREGLIAIRKKRGQEFSLEDVKPIYETMKHYAEFAAQQAKQEGDDASYEQAGNFLKGGAQAEYERLTNTNTNNEYEYE